MKISGVNYNLCLNSSKNQNKDSLDIGNSKPSFGMKIDTEICDHLNRLYLGALCHVMRSDYPKELKMNKLDNVGKQMSELRKSIDAAENRNDGLSMKTEVNGTNNKPPFYTIRISSTEKNTRSSLYNMESNNLSMNECEKRFYYASNGCKSLCNNKKLIDELKDNYKNRFNWIKKLDEKLNIFRTTKSKPECEIEIDKEIDDLYDKWSDNQKLIPIEVKRESIKEKFLNFFN